MLARTINRPTGREDALYSARCSCPMTDEDALRARAQAWSDLTSEPAAALHLADHALCLLDSSSESEGVDALTAHTDTVRDLPVRMVTRRWGEAATGPDPAKMADV